LGVVTPTLNIDQNSLANQPTGFMQSPSLGTIGAETAFFPEVKKPARERAGMRESAINNKNRRAEAMSKSGGGQYLLRRADPMKVADCMTPEPVCLTADAILTAAIALMETGDFRAVPITLNGKLVGIISDRDIRSCRTEPEATKVSEIMSKDPISISPDDSVNEAVRMILSCKIGGLPVVKGDSLVGIITATDILKAVLGFPAFNA
jgi:CBS domain-containing protein